ncbi:MAG: site-specific integrase, partial [Rhodospirillaceae bacterium]|nr:site-specific integrase [Rhodospirillaceae bacterium]
MFLEMMAAERGASPHTLDAYRRDLADFAAFAGRRG